MDSTQSEIIDELERIEEDCTHSGKSHFNASSRWGSYHYWIGIPATVIGTVAGTAFFADWPKLGGFLALVAAMLTALQTFLKPSERAAEHKAAGAQYLALKNDCRVLRRVNLLRLETQLGAEKLDELNQRRNALNTGSPPFSEADRQKTNEGIAKGEAKYDVDTRL